MSNRIFQAVWDQGPEARSEMIVLMVLADCADAETGTCFPSKRHIAHHARMSIPTVKRVLAALKADGWISVSKNTRKDGSSTANIYSVSFEKLGLERVVRRRHARRDRGDQNEPPPDQNDPPAGIKMSPYGGDQNEPPITNHIEQRRKAVPPDVFEAWQNAPLETKGTLAAFAAKHMQ